jgi:hypothetical protein
VWQESSKLDALFVLSLGRSLQKVSPVRADKKPSGAGLFTHLHCLPWTFSLSIVLAPFRTMAKPARRIW